jgi:hypothetical protein
MYCTKSLFPKKAASYITIGDPYQPKKKSVDSRRTGKQFVNNPPKEGQYFGTHKYMGDKYQQTVAYFKLQPPDKRKNGFGSGDASKRDQYSNQIAMNQYREQLKCESKSMKKGKKAAEEAAAAKNKESPLARLEAELEEVTEAKETKKDDRMLFDLIFHVVPDESVGKSCSRHKKINRGTAWTANSVFGDGITADSTAKAGKQSAQHGRQNVTKDFYNANHLHTDTN